MSLIRMLKLQPNRSVDRFFETPAQRRWDMHRQIVSSILAGVFDDKLCSEVERNPEEATDVLEVAPFMSQRLFTPSQGVLENSKLRPLQEKLQHEGQMTVYLMYLHRFLLAFGKVRAVLNAPILIAVSTLAGENHAVARCH